MRVCDEADWEKLGMDHMRSEGFQFLFVPLKDVATLPRDLVVAISSFTPYISFFNNSCSDNFSKTRSDWLPSYTIPM